MVRIVTYNVHSCVGTDKKVSPSRIAEVIADCRADIIALQEVDVGRSRTGGVDQAHAIAAHLNMTAHFHPALHVEEEKYGDAILTALPSRLIKAAPLPSLHEQRGAIWMNIDIGAMRLQVINTHLGLFRRERQAQISALLGPLWLAHPACEPPVVLVGDFNAGPRSGSYGRIIARLRDAQRGIEQRPMPTFPSRLPFLRIDHLFYSGPLEVTAARVRRDRLSRLASDHLPLVVDFEPVRTNAIGHGGSQVTREMIEQPTNTAEPTISNP